MVVKKISFVFIVLAIAIVGTAISSALAADDAAKLARRDKMIAALKAEYAAKKAETTEIVVEKEVEVTEIVVEKEVEVTEIVVEKKAEAAEIVTETITEAESVTTEKISEVKDAAKAASEHPTEHPK
jgi:hypothetical protein